MSNTENGFIWRSQSAFVIVAVGATLSLNDFLTFPVLAGQNGGGAFLLLYLLFLFVLGLPLLMVELMLGRLTRSDPSSCLRTLSEQYRASVYWKLAGLGSMFAAFLIVSTFSVIAGWSLAYAVRSLAGVFDGATLESARLLFEELTIDSERMALWHTLFVIILVSISAQPIKQGVERIMLVLVPAMMFLLVIGLILALTSSSFVDSIRYILYTDFSAIDSHTPILALQRAFYTLALGIGVMIAFGRYLPGGVSIGYSAALVITVDLLFSIFTGLSINALMLSAGHEPGTDSQFAFRIMPVILSHFSSGGIYSMLFFLLMTIAALTTSIALLEAPITYFQRKCKVSRLKAAVLLGLGVWLFGLGVVLAHSVWNGEGFTVALFFGDQAVRLVNNAGFHDVLVFMSSHLVQPLVALFICLFVAWKIPREISHKEFALSRNYIYEIWNYLIRYIVPVLLLIVILAAFGLI
ncbi:MAG: sodium-dependent transporter [Gammaproteobacteria bacterium]|nr:MAG: sodium-dependent transporter [Gammaproteobacteria bacterium]UCH39509.1 MAG: sodium-dependent transporter [Gammaproteobacteria bacterium]